MRLDPLYRLTFRYRHRWEARVADELHQLLEGEGRCEGRISGRFHGVNRARRRPDGAYEPDYHAVVETDDGAVLLWDLGGYGFPGEGRVLVAIKHLTSDERYGWLNRALCAASGEVRRDDEGTAIVLDVAELAWEPIR